MFVACAIERDRAHDAVRLVLRLLEHALDLAADALGDSRGAASNRRAAGSSVLIESRRYSKCDELVERLVELGEQERRRRRAIARDAFEVPVELGFEPGRVPAVAPALLDAVAQRREQSLEIRRVWSGEFVGCVGHAAECTGLVGDGRERTSGSLTA